MGQNNSKDKIKLKTGKHVPGLAICWYVAKMLAEKDFLTWFVNRYSKSEDTINIESAEIIREYAIGSKRIDICILLTDTENTKRAFVIEVKVHWPEQEPLNESLITFEQERPEYKGNIVGLHFISTVVRKQLEALCRVRNDFECEIIRVQEFIGDFCLLGIEKGFSLRWASDLHQLLEYEE